MLTYDENLLLQLPQEALDIILAHADARSLCCLASTCRAFNAAVDDNRLWKRLAEFTLGVEEPAKVVEVTQDLGASSKAGTSFRTIVQTQIGRSTAYWAQTAGCCIIRAGDVPPQHQPPATCVHGDGSLLVEGLDNGYIRVWRRQGLLCGVQGGATREATRWRLHEGGAAQRAAHLGAVTAVHICAEDGLVASCGSDGTMAVFDIRTGLEAHRTSPTMANDQRRTLNSMAVNCTRMLVSDAGDDGTCNVYDFHTWHPLRTLQGHSQGVYSCAWLDARTLCTASFDGTVRLWDVRSGSPEAAVIPALMRDTRAYCAVGGTFANLLFSAHGDGSVRAWDLRGLGSALATMRGHVRWVEDMAFSSRALVTASVDCTLRVWDTSTFKEARTFRNHPASVLGCTFAGSDSVVSCSVDGSLYEFVELEASNLDSEAHNVSTRAHSLSRTNSRPRPRWPSMPAFTSQKGGRGFVHRRSITAMYWTGGS